MYNSYAICAPRCIALLFIYAPTYVNESIIWKYLPLRRIRYAYGTPCDSLLLTVLVQFFPPRALPTMASLFASSRSTDLSSWSLSFVVPARAFVPRPRSFSPAPSFPPSPIFSSSRSPAEIAKRIHFVFSWAQACVYHRVTQYRMILKGVSEGEGVEEETFDRLFHVSCLK